MDLKKGPFLFRSHHDPRLGVYMSHENLTSLLKERLNMSIDMEGWTITIAVPGSLVMTEPFNYIDMKFEPDIDIDLEEVDWGSAMEEELDWLTSIGVIKGLTSRDVEDISSLSQLGAMGANKRVFYFPYDHDWVRFNEIIFREILLGAGPPQAYSSTELPESVAPIPHDEEEFTISIGMLVIIASVLIFLFISSFFYHRINRATKLNNTRRKLIYELITSEPGIHFSAIMKELNLKPGVASYHINRLEKMELIKSFQDGMYRRFYLYDQKIEMKVALSDLQTLIINVVEDEPGISQVGISKMIGKSKVVINYHVRFLRDLGILILERDGRKTHCFLTDRGTELARA
jgi:predicted transcriptional regulator